MNDKKLPLAGEWWQYNGVRVRIVGTMLNGHLVCEYKDGKTATLVQGNWWQHLPDCTGWDWVPEVWPKWYETTSPTEYAFVRRDDEENYTAVRRNGTDGPTGLWNRQQATIRAELTESEAKARLTPPVHKCPDCGEPDGPRHADVCPMAWVTQDRVAARPGIDQRAYKYESDTSLMQHWDDAANIDWEKMPRHGTVRGIATVHLRCRRKDLPPVPAKTKIPLRAWVTTKFITSRTGCSLWISPHDLSGSGVTEVHGLNLHIEDPSASGSADGTKEASALV